MKKKYQVRIIDLDKVVILIASDEADLINQLMKYYRGMDYEILGMEEAPEYSQDISKRTLENYFPFDL